MKPHLFAVPDSERCILSALIQAGDEGKEEIKQKCSDALPVEAFTQAAHRAIFRVITANGRLLDIPATWREIEKADLTGQIDKAYLMKVAHFATGYAHLDYHLGEVLQAYQVRKAAEEEGPVSHRANEKSNFGMVDVRAWLEAQPLDAKFHNKNLYQALGAQALNDKAKCRVYLNRAVKEGWAGPDPMMVDRFLVSRPIKPTDFSKVEIVTETFKLKLPLGLHEQAIKVRAGHVILVAGDTGSGKSTFAYETASLNYESLPIQHFIEPGEQKDFEQKDHMLKLGMDLAHRNVRVYDKIPGYEYAIEQTKGLLIVDYVLPKEDFSDAGNLIKAVTDRVRYGVAILFTQKHPYYLKPYGGRLAYHHVHHVICLDRVADQRGEMILVKVQSGGLPLGSRCFYTIENDLYFKPYDPLALKWDAVDIRERWDGQGPKKGGK